MEQHYHLNGEHRFHPVREYLANLVWDGEERIAHTLPKFLMENGSRVMIKRKLFEEYLNNASVI